MALYTENGTIANGICKAVNHAILAGTTATPGVFSPLHALLNGYPKVLIIHWRGPMEDAAIGMDWSKDRGDGDLEIAGEGSSLYRIPPNIEEPLNLWAGIPLWLLGHHADGRLQPLGCGLLHPLKNSAHLDFYHPHNGDHLARSYFCDPRSEWPDHEEERIAMVNARAKREERELAEMNAALINFYRVADQRDWPQEFA